MLPYLRIYVTSIVNYIKYEVLPINFLEYVEGLPLIPGSVAGTYIIDSAELSPNPAGAGRGFFPFDESSVGGKPYIDTTSEQTTRITVNGASSYDIDYLTGTIKNVDATPSSVDFYWNYVSVVEGWPGIDPPEIPIVAVDIQTKQGQGYQLGLGTKDIVSGSIHIFSSSESEKQEITDAIHVGLDSRSISIVDWTNGGYLNYDGSFNTSFAPTTVSGVSSGFFTNVVSRLDLPRFDWSELNRHRSKITFEFEVYR
jgi:hypothetical protein